MPERVNVQGLKELRAALRAIDGTLPRELQRTNKRAAADVIVPAARRLAESRTNPRWGHLAVASIRALASQTRAQVALGSQKVRWAAGENFGSFKYHQFPPSKGYRAGDYALYESIDREQAALIATYTDLLETLIDTLPG